MLCEGSGKGDAQVAPTRRHKPNDMMLQRLRGQPTRLARVFGRSASTKKAVANEPNLQEKVVTLCRHRGFIFPGSEIYGGLANSFDYGPLGMVV